jgi:hypothetical protein
MPSVRGPTDGPRCHGFMAFGPYKSPMETDDGNGLRHSDNTAELQNRDAASQTVIPGGVQKMDDSLRDVISAAVRGSGRKAIDAPVKPRTPVLSVVEAEHRGTRVAQPAPAAEPPKKVSSGTARRTPPSGGSHELGYSGLRLAFWVCGFHDALMERHRQGAQLTEKEKLLLTLSTQDFEGIRPFVIDLTLSRLDAVVNAPDLPAEPDDLAALHPMEAFALTTLRNLARLAGQTLADDGPDAALSLFGQKAGVLEPLAIFQPVFTTALDIVESFERIIPGNAGLLSRLAEALDSEMDRI